MASLMAYLPPGRARWREIASTNTGRRHARPGARAARRAALALPTDGLVVHVSQAVHVDAEAARRPRQPRPELPGRARRERLRDDGEVDRQAVVLEEVEHREEPLVAPPHIVDAEEEAD